MTFGGLLIGGRVVPVPDHHVDNERTASWSRLTSGDYRTRSTSWVRQAIIHTTKGIHPAQLVETLPGGKDEILADFYRDDPEHNGCSAAADLDGTGACYADLLRYAPHHATTSNPWSWGLEIYQLGDGTITRASLRVALEMVVVGCTELGIPLQMHRAPYRSGRIVRRLRDGGPDCVGIFGHRDQSWKEPRHLPAAVRKRYPDGYAGRGRGDPGDLVLEYFAADPRIECFDFDAREDLAAWRRRQAKLNAMGARLTVDGVCGPGTMRELRERGFADGRELDDAVEAVT